PPTFQIVLVPLIVVLPAFFALGAASIVSVLTAKYRDLHNAVQFRLRLVMLLTPVVCGAFLLEATPFRLLFWLNPLTPVVEVFRGAFLTHAAVPQEYILWAMLLVRILVAVGAWLFKKQEIKVMDII